MEVKMNKEIRDYQESMFWGLDRKSTRLNSSHIL